jgi:hypothetical protein
VHNISIDVQPIPEVAAVNSYQANASLDGTKIVNRLEVKRIVIKESEYLTWGYSGSTKGMVPILPTIAP